LGLAERKDVLERSGLCTFCLKHSAEFECYGKGGLSKPRCTRSGCDGEHTPNVHRLMGEDDAKVTLIAGDEREEEYKARDEYGIECEYKWEYEDGGLWVGTVGAVEVLGWGEEAPCSTGAPASVLDGHPGGVRDADQPKQRSVFQGNEDPENEPAEDRWWDLGMECNSLEDKEAGAPQAELPHHLPYEASQLDLPIVTGEQRTRKKQKTTADRRWEEAREKARLRQTLSDSSSSEDEDEDEDDERHRRFTGSGRWMLELNGPPWHITTTSEGECSK
jgi:hypothetical protein